MLTSAKPVLAMSKVFIFFVIIIITTTQTTQTIYYILTGCDLEYSFLRHVSALFLSIFGYSQSS